MCEVYKYTMTFASVGCYDTIFTISPILETLQLLRGSDFQAESNYIAYCSIFSSHLAFCNR